MEYIENVKLIKLTVKIQYIEFVKLIVKVPYFGAYPTLCMSRFYPISHPNFLLHLLCEVPMSLSNRQIIYYSKTFKKRLHAFNIGCPLTWDEIQRHVFSENYLILKRNYFIQQNIMELCKTIYIGRLRQKIFCNLPREIVGLICQKILDTRYDAKVWFNNPNNDLLPFDPTPKETERFVYLKRDTFFREYKLLEKERKWELSVVNTVLHYPFIPQRRTVYEYNDVKDYIDDPQILYVFYKNVLYNKQNLLKKLKNGEIIYGQPGCKYCGCFIQKAKHNPGQCMFNPKNRYKLFF